MVLRLEPGQLLQAYNQSVLREKDYATPSSSEDATSTGVNKQCLRTAVERNKSLVPLLRFVRIELNRRDRKLAPRRENVQGPAVTANKSKFHVKARSQTNAVAARLQRLYTERVFLLRIRVP